MSADYRSDRQLCYNSAKGWFVATCIFACLASQVQSLDNGKMLTPAMGFNPWNAFHTDINESVILETVDLMLSLGLVDAGYNHFNLDDGWSEMERDADNRLVASKTKFPSGIKWLADRVHKKGMRLGIYSDAGYFTCMHYPASYGVESLDAETFASWDVDFLKYDNCYSPPLNEASVSYRYDAMRAALNKTGRAITYSMCEWGVSNPWLYGQKVGNSWRTNDDISLGIEAEWKGVVYNLDATVGLSRFAGPGGWNDADMLEVGLPGGKRLTHIEQQAHFALWAIIKSPLLIGADLRLLGAQELAILKAKEVIALNQDPLGVAGDLIWKQGPNEVWATVLAGGDRGVVLFNRHLREEPTFVSAELSVSWALLGLPRLCEAEVRDLFLEKDLGTFQESFSARVQNHGVVALRIHPVRNGAMYESWRPWTCGISTAHQEDFTCLGHLKEESRSTARAPIFGFQTGVLIGVFGLLLCLKGRFVLACLRRRSR